MTWNSCFWYGWKVLEYIPYSFFCTEFWACIVCHSFQPFWYSSYIWIDVHCMLLRGNRDSLWWRHSHHMRQYRFSLMKAFTPHARFFLSKQNQRGLLPYSILHNLNQCFSTLATSKCVDINPQPTGLNLFPGSYLTFDKIRTIFSALARTYFGTQRICFLMQLIKA